MRQADLNDLREVTSREELLAALTRVGATMGFSIGTVALRKGQFNGGAVFNSVTNAPQAWQELAGNPELHKVDPVFHRLNTSREPFIYDLDFYAEHGAGDFWDMAAPYGFVSGVSASLQLGADGVLFWGFDTDEKIAKDEERRLRLMSDNLLIGVVASGAAERILAPPKPALNERHMQILHLIKAGKSSGVIAQLIGISENTVNFHVKTLCSLLNVASRHQALAKVMELGLLA